MIYVPIPKLYRTFVMILGELRKQDTPIIYILEVERYCPPIR
ncbi:hypothetical protein HMPREF0645_1943 [Hallella bergensis DSM 17361]|uniref:Uncharacterized protein n=1 Tax=Hallella bergensis DSM 17361 TaxID=585502 RepID=D1PYA8_9BACT|nr:hypothetical protein HMPREF0645_1943 [Hallella bergensis DSM 17361]